MAKQDRAIRTRQTIIAAAARVFEENGYQAATITQILKEAGVTKGALYFHFGSKEELAHGVLAEQGQAWSLPARPSKVQELVDAVMVHAHRLQTDPLVRASVRLTLDPHAYGLDRTGPFREFGGVCRKILTAAKDQGELLPHVDIAEASDILVGSFAGVQAMSETLTNYADLSERARSLLRYLLPAAVVPSVLAALDYPVDRGAVVFAEIQAFEGAAAE
ncbi:ScbR family autoregulator-binding transcription factor [Streptomyces sp. NPDC006704]|uniref:ScbR family autoregulator-binding transcription factor n=1 Tax=Streptomyces sp. NPDC006704 TaxID=3364760 RepID=UPI00367995E2